MRKNCENFPNSASSDLQLRWENDENLITQTLNDISAMKIDNFPSFFRNYGFISAVEL